MNISTLKKEKGKILTFEKETLKKIAKKKEV
jgi:hypothetical protein